MWHSTEFSLGSITFYFVYSRNPINCGKFWVSHAFLCQQPPDLCPLRSEGSVYILFQLGQYHQGVDSKQPFTAQSGQSGSYLARFSMSPLPDDAHDHRNVLTIPQSSQSWLPGLLTVALILGLRPRPSGFALNAGKPFRRRLKTYLFNPPGYLSS